MNRGREGYNMPSNANKATDKSVSTSQRKILFTLGYYLNNLMYFIYIILIYESLYKVISFLHSSHAHPIGDNNAALLELFIGIVATLSFSRLLSQSFDGDAFSHILFMRYRLINRAEMFCRVIGTMLAGATVGILYYGVLRNLFVHSCVPSLNSLITVDFAGVKKVVNNVSYPILDAYFPLEYRKKFIYNVLKEYKLLPHPLRIADFAVVEEYLAKIMKVMFVEFGFCVAFYMVLSIYLVCDHVCKHFIDLFVCYKKMVMFVANIMLLPLKAVVTLDASTSLMYYFDNRDFFLLCCRILTNYLAIIVASKLFNPCKYMKREVFEKVYTNIILDRDMKCVTYKGKDEVVKSEFIENRFIVFSDYPKTRLGNFLRRIEHKLLQKKRD